MMVLPREAFIRCNNQNFWANFSSLCDFQNIFIWKVQTNEFFCLGFFYNEETTPRAVKVGLSYLKPTFLKFITYVFKYLFDGFTFLFAYFNTEECNKFKGLALKFDLLFLVPFYHPTFWVFLFSHIGRQSIFYSIRVLGFTGKLLYILKIKSELGLIIVQAVVKTIIKSRPNEAFS